MRIGLLLGLAVGWLLVRRLSRVRVADPWWDAATLADYYRRTAKARAMYPDAWTVDPPTYASVLPWWVYYS